MKWWQIALASRAFTILGTLVLAILAFWIYLKVIPRGAPSVTAPQGPVVAAQLPPGKPGRDTLKIIERAVPVPGPKEIVYLPSQKIAASLKFPEIKTLHDNVIAVGVAAPHRGNTTIVATLGAGSDNVYRGGILLRQEAVPFFGREREWHGGIWYGLAGRNKVQGEVEFLPVRIGPAYPTIKGVVGLEAGGSMNGQILLGVRF